MPFVGPVFNITSNEFYPAVEDTIIDAEAWNAVAEDLANGLTAVVTRDGAGFMSGSLNMGSNKIVSVSAATNPGDAPRFDQIQPVDATLTAIAALAFDATNNLMYSTGADTFALLATTAAGRTALTFVDPNTDQILFWDDSEGKFTGLTLGTGLSITTTTLSLSANLQAWSALTPGTAATKNTGTSGNNVPLLDGANTWSATQKFSVGLTIDAAGLSYTLARDSGSGFLHITGEQSSASGYVFRTNNGAIAAFTIGNSGALLANGVAVPTISSSDTLSNKTLSSPTLSGTVAGAHSYSGQVTFTAGATTIFNRASSPEYLIQLNDNGSTRGYIGANSSYVLSVKDSGGTDKLLVATGGDIIGSASGPTSVYSLGYRGLGNLNGQNNAYTFVLADAGRNVYHSTGTHAFEIPPNSSVAFPIGTAIEILQFGGTLTITEGSGVTLYRWDGTSGTGTRTVGQRSTAVIQKITTNEWIIMGAALT